MVRLLLPLAIALLGAGPLAAQDNRWQITLDGGEYVWDVRLDRLAGDSLFVRQADSLRPLPVERITVTHNGASKTVPAKLAKAGATVDLSL